VLQKIKVLPNLNSIPKLTGSLEATKFAATVSDIFPNPIAGALLAIQISSTLAAAAELVEEAEEEEQQTTTTTASSSTSTSSSSAAPTATEYVVCLSKKWPALLIDAFVEAFPEDGIQTDLSALKLTLFATNMTEDLADIVSLLPIFNFVVPDQIPDAIADTVSDNQPSTGTRKKRDSTESQRFARDSAPSGKRALPPRGAAVVKRAFNTQFPFVSDLSLSDQTPAEPFLSLISFKRGSNVGSDDTYYHERTIRGQKVLIYVLDSGFGMGTSPPVSHISSSHFLP